MPPEIEQQVRRLEQTYRFDGQEDKGANGWLFFATSRVTGAAVAIKFYWWGLQPALHAEPRTLAQFHSENIVPIMAAELIGGGWAYFICPRFASDLERMIQGAPISICHSIDLALGVLSGISALHCADIVHRDLKPANILVRHDGIAAIGDFGSVASVDNEGGDAPASRHSIIYRPPESVATSRFNKQGDLYQIAITLYELLGGSLPKDPTSWMSNLERDTYNATENECDKSIFVDDVLGRKITRGRLLDRGSLPFYVPSALIRHVFKQTQVLSTARLQSVAPVMAGLVAARRQTIDWVGTAEGAEGRFGDMRARVIVAGDDHRVEIDRGRGWRRDKSAESNCPRASCEIVNGRFCR